MVVVPEPSVKGGSTLVAVAVDRTICPAAEHGADESLSLPIRLGPVGAGAEVSDADRAAGDCMHDRAIAGAVVGQQLLDGHSVAGEERDRTPKKDDDGRGLLIAERHARCGRAS